MNGWNIVFWSVNVVTAQVIENARRFRGLVTQERTSQGPWIYPMIRVMGSKIALCCAMAALAMTPVLLIGQIETGTVVGTVEDRTGAVIPGAAVVVKSLDSGIVTELVTNDAGRYQAPPLKPGQYEVSVTSKGFKTAVLRVRVEVNQRVGADFLLDVGDTAEQVTVEATALQLESESSTLGNIRPERAVKELPLNVRNFATLIFLSAGTVPSFDRDAGGLPGTTRRGVSNASVNGMRPTNDWNSILIEGLDNTENHNAFGAAIFPSVDAIQEFKLQTSAADAQFGRAAGGFTNVVLKSGGRNLHGVLFSFHRNSEFDANNFFARPGDNTHFVMNQFGGTLGGPVVLPGYNRGRDKTFFFVSTQLDIRRQALAFVSTVPTAAMKGGDFSAFPAGVYDPLTISGNTRELFPGNRIPASRFSRAGKGLTDLYPDPNQSGAVNNYVRAPGRNYDSHQTDFKFDHYVNQNHSMTFRGSVGNTDIISGTPLPLPAAGDVGPSEFPARQLAAIDRFTVSPNKLNEFRVGFTRVNMLLLQPNLGSNIANELGIPGINAGGDITSGLPRVNVTGFRALGDDPFNPGILVTNNYQVEDVFYWTASNHSIRFGGRLDRRQYNAFQSSAIRGVYNFTGAYSNNPARPAGTGVAVADMLLGGPISGNINILEGTRGFRRWELGTFIQDDWKVTQRLTLNLGLRHELYPQYPWVEVGDRGSQFIIGTGELVRVGTGGVSRYGANADLNNFAPRIGLAYRMTEKTIIRTAYGVFYAAPQFEINRNLSLNPPFAGGNSFANNQLNFAGARKLEAGFDRSFAAAGASLKALDTNLRMPYVQQWNFNVQRQLPGNTMLTLAYVGTKGTKLRDEIDINQPPPGPGAVAPRRPYPLYNAIAYTAFRANSNYHGLQATFEKRYSKGLSFLTSYTWGHNIDDAGIFGGDHQDTRNLRADRSNSPYDTRHTFVYSFNYELPFARGASGVAAALAKGWQINGILRLSTGQFLTPTVGPNNLNGAGFQRADVVPGCNWNLDNPTPNRWFDAGCFTIPAQFTYGNAGRNIIEGPGTRNFDFSIFRNIYLSKGDTPRQLQLRGEMFNITNTPQFNQPNGTIGTANVATINSAGSPTSFQRVQRQIQLGAKFIF